MAAVVCHRNNPGIGSVNFFLFFLFFLFSLAVKAARTVNNKGQLEVRECLYLRRTADGRLPSAQAHRRAFKKMQKPELHTAVWARAQTQHLKETQLQNVQSYLCSLTVTNCRFTDVFSS